MKKEQEVQEQKVEIERLRALGIKTIMTDAEV